MTADDVGQPVEPGPAEPELDDYGVPVKAEQPARLPAYLFEAFCFIVAVAEVVGFIQFTHVERPHHDLPVGLRVFVLASALLGLTTVVLRFSVFRNAVIQRPPGRIIMGLVFVITLIGSIYLLSFGLFPHLCDNGGCNGGGY